MFGFENTKTPPTLQGKAPAFLKARSSTWLIGFTAFVAAFTVSSDRHPFSRVNGEINQKARMASYTPPWAVSTIPPAQLIDSSRWFPSFPSLWWIDPGYQRTMVRRKVCELDGRMTKCYDLQCNSGYQLSWSLLASQWPLVLVSLPSFPEAEETLLMYQQQLLDGLPIEVRRDSGPFS